jgi:hypothetical protein
MNREWFMTYTGKRMRLWDPDPSLICIEDIAHHLALQNRWTGASFAPYNVAQHSVHVSRLAPSGFELDGFGHDFHEYALGDSARPVKRSFGEDYRRLVEIWDRAIASALNLNADRWHSPEVKHADLVALATERRDLFPFGYWDADGADLDVKAHEYAVPAHPGIIHPWYWRDAEELFLERWRELRQ